MRMPPPPEIHVVPHTHWDREWYLPFAVYRRRLVALLDSLLLALPREPGLRFHLDGQMAVVDDYLEARPERLAALRAAAAAGRVSLGPWYTLPDEHLVSGESLLRNLELGLERAREVGEPMAVGYLPDQFGHTAQMPQLLRLRGIETAVVWRGVPAGQVGGVFEWEALDGSSVRTVHLQRGYGHGRGLPLSAGELRDRLAKETWAPAGPWLVMAGDDHQPVPSGLAAALGSVRSGRPAAISSLADFIAAAPAPEGTLRGELHSAATSFVLKGTLSARFPLKLEHAALERLVERQLEPIWTLTGRPWPERELRYIWRQLILNSAHDTICGCSIDQVHRQGSERIERAVRAAGALLRRLGVEEGGETFFNPSSFERFGIPPLGTGAPERVEARTLAVPDGLLFEDQPDRGDLYTFEPAGAAVRRPATGIAAERLGAEPLTRLQVDLVNQTPDHRLRLLIPADTSEGAWAGVAFGAVRRPFRKPGSEDGWEYDLRTDPAREWVVAGGVGVILAGPFEYELLDGCIAVTLLRCAGRLSRGDLANRPGNAGPEIATPEGQMLGPHHFELALLAGVTDHLEVARWAEVFCHPLAPAPAGMAPPPNLSGSRSEFVSALRRVGARAQLRTYDLADFRIRERWLD
jgi:Glycosyl hydrolases family 38 N-terminal domain/Alpha mannosidase middle domain